MKCQNGLSDMSDPFEHSEIVVFLMENSTNSVSKENKKFSTLHICGMCGGMVGFQLAYVVVFGLVDPIMTKMELNDFAKTAAWLLGPIIGFIVQPIVGYYSDRSISKY